MTATRLCVWLPLALSVLFSADGQENCGFYYLTQPPTDLPCNPYLDTSRFSVRIECTVAVNRSIEGTEDAADFEIRWFAQLGSESIPVEVALNGTSSFGVRIDQPTAVTTAFYVYQSQLRISAMNSDTFDRFWCEIYISDAFKDTTNITDLERSHQTLITDNNLYTSLPVCPPQAFFHQTVLTCADFPLSVENDTQVELPLSSSSPLIQIPPTPIPSGTPASCPQINTSEDSGQTSRLVSVLLPSLIFPVVVAVLLVITAVIMAYCRNRKLERRGRKANETATAESPILITSPVGQKKVAPTRPPPPVFQPEKNGIHPSGPLLPPTSKPTTATRPNNRFSQDIYDDIADSVIESYSKSTNDLYTMQGEMTSAEPGEERRPELDIPIYLNGPGYKLKVKEEEAHYRNAALLSIAERRVAPTGLPTTTSLPSLLDPKHYNNSVSSRRHTNETSTQKGDLYDTLARNKTSSPTYYNQTKNSASVALEMGEDEPDYDEVYDEEEVPPSNMFNSRPSQTSAKSGKPNRAGRNPNKYSLGIMSEGYEDMSSIDDFIESFKSAKVATAL